MGIFSKKSGSVTHNYIWVPNTMLSEKTNEPNLRKLTDRLKDRRKDGWTDHILWGPSGRGRGSKKMECFLSVGFTAGKLFEIVYSRKKNYNAIPTIPIPYDIIARNKMISIRNRRHFYQILNCHRIPEISKDFSNSGCYKIISHLENMNPPIFL